MGKLQGCIPIVVTPFTQEGAIDEGSLRAEVEYLVASGVQGVATPAIASESYKLAEAEQQRVAAIVVEMVAGRVPVVVSADGNGTDVAVLRARRAAALGAAALMVLPPMFIKPDGENLYRYYQRIARAVEVEIMVQDAPQLTGVPLPAPLLARLNRDCPNITAVKIEGTPAGPKTSEVLALSDNRMDVFAGWGGLSFWEGLQRGAKGAMPAANFGPVLAHVYDRYRAGDYAAARNLFDRITPFIVWSMQSVDLSVWCAKEALRREGILATNVLREPASLPDAVMRHEFDVFYHAGSGATATRQAL
jgi:dihydrodipicolinate synthase/N-acetylneuraminate lyase